MKIITWNVNGLRAIIAKNFYEFVEEYKPDILCLQEIKMQKDQVRVDLDSYYKYFNYALKKGYSGVCIFSKIKPLNVNYNFGVDGYDEEGRVITLEFDDYYLICEYTPNSKDELLRLEYRILWEKERRKYINKLLDKKPIIICGDFNCAPNEIDLTNPSINKFNPGFTKEERSEFKNMLDLSFIDVYRYLYPTKIEYTWWSYRMLSREKNIGWRIDHFLVTSNIINKVKDIKILTQVFGSDHAPVLLELK